MNTNLKKRIYTSVILFLIVFLMLINNYVLGYFLMIASILSLLEFMRMTMKIYVNEKIKVLTLNAIFTIYIFIFSSAFLMFANFFHFKILLFILLFTCIASDIGGFVFGKFLEGPKLSKISPNKTIAGSIGSILLSTITLIIIIYFFTKNFELYNLFIAIITSVSCQLGDLFFSYLKRKSKLKDTGNLLPGHGGVLDRVDGILLGMPIGFITLLLLN
mgnify:FL=1|tara:strand:+ start:6897 stop:7547 length:651 start_codon:yes stop_codon:yes gene_type:complete